MRSVHEELACTYCSLLHNYAGDSFIFRDMCCPSESLLPLVVPLVFFIKNLCNYTFCKTSIPRLSSLSLISQLQDKIRIELQNGLRLLWYEASRLFYVA